MLKISCSFNDLMDMVMDFDKFVAWYLLVVSNARFNDDHILLVRLHLYSFLMDIFLIIVFKMRRQVK